MSSIKDVAVQQYGMIKMTDCYECKNFEQELDTNYQGCRKEDDITDDEWYNKVECRFFDKMDGIEK